MNINYFKKSLLFTVGVHGDEHTPVLVAQSMLPNGSFLICHPEALIKNSRYIESDLNRSFPGNQGSTVEEKIAYFLVKKLIKYQSVIDLHTATCATPPFIIITKTTLAHLDLAGQTGINKLVLMSQEFGAGKSLVDFVPVGISIESGREKSIKTRKIIEKIITNVFKKNTVKKQMRIYKVFKTLTKTGHGEYLVPTLHPFKLVTAGTKITNLNRVADVDFYPVLARSKNYPNFLCLMAKKINLSDFNVKISS